MKLSATYQTRRSAFTLIELLVVMTILALLVALLAAGVFKTLNKVADVRNTRELRELRTDLVNFQAKFKVDYVPSRFILCETKNDYYLDPPPATPPYTTFKSQLHQDSFTYLSRLWHQLDWNTPHPPPPGVPTWVGIDWNGDGQPSPGVLLEGDQCLVFFLGGIQDTTNPKALNCLGFSTNPRNPAAVTGDRIEPFFDFKSERLVILPPKYRLLTAPTINPLSNTYFSYLDAYGGQPFAFFSSYKTANGYFRYGNPADCASLNQLSFKTGSPFPSPPGPYAPPSPYGVTTSLGIKYENSDTFQIISSGRDGIFGPGGQWSPATAEKVPAVGRDDMSDFYDRMLGVPAN